jgi:hypothetical protein
LTELRGVLGEPVVALEVDLPLYLPVVGYGLCSDLPPAERRCSGATAVDDVALPSLLSLALGELTLASERDAEVSPPVSANLLRLLGDAAVLPRDLPALAGVTKESVAVGIGLLERHGFAEPGPRRPYRDRIAQLLADPLGALPRHPVVTHRGR